MSSITVDTQLHAVYLLTSLDPLCQQSSYIGYTIDPERRVRQHNGELVAGAQKTKRRGRPWKMELCVIGFCNKHAALRFEWQWQHPLDTSQSMRSRFNKIRRYIGFQHAYKARIAVLHEMLNDGRWKNDSLTLHFFGTSRIRYDDTIGEIQSKILLVHGLPGDITCAQLPVKRKVAVLRQHNSLLSIPVTVGIQSGDFADVRKMPENLTKANGESQSVDILGTLFADSPPKGQLGLGSPINLPPDGLCVLCSNSMRVHHLLKCPSCPCAAHILCLADWFEAHSPRQMHQWCALHLELVPQHASPCPTCRKENIWGDYVRVYKSQARVAANEAVVQEKVEFKARYALFRKRSKTK